MQEFQIDRKSPENSATSVLVYANSMFAKLTARVQSGLKSLESKIDDAIIVATESPVRGSKQSSKQETATTPSQAQSAPVVSTSTTPPVKPSSPPQDAVKPVIAELPPVDTPTETTIDTPADTPSDTTTHTPTDTDADTTTDIIVDASADIVVDAPADVVADSAPIEPAAEMKEAESTQPSANQEQVSILSTQVTTLSRVISSRDQEIEQLRKQLKDAEAAAGTVAQRSMKQLKEKDALVVRAERERDDAIRRMSEIRESRDAAVREKDIHIAKLLEEGEELHREHAKLEDRLKKIRTSHRDDAAKISALEEQLAAARKLKQGAETVAASEQEANTALIAKLREALAESAATAGATEDKLRAELEELRHRCRESDARIAQLVRDMSEQSRPLAQQLEIVQRDARDRAAVWEQREGELIEQIRDAEQALASAHAQERAMLQRCEEMKQRVVALEAELHSLSQARDRFAAEASAAQSQLTLVQRKADMLAAENRNLQQTLNDAQRRIRVAESHHNTHATPPALTLPLDHVPPFGGALSIHGPESASSDISDFDMDDGLMYKHPRSVEQMQKRVGELERMNNSLSSELGAQAARCMQLEQQMAHSQTALAELNKRYTAALELLGDKTEEVEVIRSDLMDAKNLYRNQITLLLDEIENLKKR